MIMNNNYCKRCRLRDGCLQKCKEAELYEQGYHDAYIEVGKIVRVCKQIKKQKEMEDTAEQVMDFIRARAYREFKGYKYKEFLESIENEIENELEELGDSEFDDCDEDE